MERGLKTNLKTDFLPLLQIGEVGRGDEVHELAIIGCLYLITEIQ